MYSSYQSSSTVSGSANNSSWELLPNLSLYLFSCCDQSYILVPARQANSLPIVIWDQIERRHEKTRRKDNQIWHKTYIRLQPSPHIHSGFSPFIPDVTRNHCCQLDLKYEARSFANHNLICADYGLACRREQQAWHKLNWQSQSMGSLLYVLSKLIVYWK